MKQRLLWVTQSVPDCHRSRSRFERQGLRTLALPVLQVEPVAAQLPSEVPDAMVFTSAHGVRYHQFQPRWKDVPVFAVGHQTAVAAVLAGYSDVRSAGGDVVDLKKLIATTLPRPARIVIFAAREVAGNLEDYLAGCSYEVERSVVYETRSASDVELGQALDRLHVIDGICVYSPKGAKRIEEIIRRSRWTGALFCLSEACAGPFGNRRDGLCIGVARRPNSDALIDLVRHNWDLAATARPVASRSLLVGHRDIPSVQRRRVSVANDNALQHYEEQTANPDDGGDEPPPTAA